MTEISKYENHYLSAYQSQKIVDMNDTQVKLGLIKLMEDLFNVSGQTINSDLHKDSNILHNDIKRYFPDLRAKEIRLFMENGVRGKYGKYFGLNVVTYNKFIEEGLNERKKALDGQREIEKKAKYEEAKRKNDELIKVNANPAPQTEEEKKQGWAKYVSDAKQRYKFPPEHAKHDKFGIYGTPATLPMLYEYLVNIGHLKAEDYVENLEEAQEIIDYEYEQMAHSHDRDERKIAQINRPKLSNENAEVINMAKQLTIEQLWNQ